MRKQRETGLPGPLPLSTVPTQLTEILVHILLRSGDSLLDDEGWVMFLTLDCSLAGGTIPLEFVRMPYMASKLYDTGGGAAAWNNAGAN